MTRGMRKVRNWIDIGSRYKRARMQKGISLARIAAQTRSPKGNIQEFEAGRLHIRESLLFELANAIPVSYAWLLGQAGAVSNFANLKGGLK